MFPQSALEVWIHYFPIIPRTHLQPLRNTYMWNTNRVPFPDRHWLVNQFHYWTRSIAHPRKRKNHLEGLLPSQSSPWTSPEGRTILGGQEKLGSLWMRLRKTICFCKPGKVGWCDAFPCSDSEWALERGRMEEITNVISKISRLTPHHSSVQQQCPNLLKMSTLQIKPPLFKQPLLP